MKLNLRQIEVFRAIMLTGSLSGASRFLHVSQPAVSRILAYIEQRVGFPLFQRHKGRLLPTPEARRLYSETNLVHQGVERINAVMNDLADHRLGSLCIASSPNLGVSLMPQAITCFNRRYPDIDVSFHTLLPDAMVQAVLTQQVDMGVGSMLFNVHPHLSCSQLCESRFVVAVPCTHPFAQRESLSIHELAGEVLIGYGDIPFGHRVRDLFHREGHAFSSRIQVHNVHVACMLVAAGAGMALIDEIMAHQFDEKSFMTVPITPEATFPVSLIHVEQEPLSRIAQAFIEILGEVIPLKRQAAKNIDVSG